MRGINPLYLDKLDPAQRKWILTMSGKKFFDHFITEKGYHCFLVGNTGSGKTQKGYWLVNWLMHTETQIWTSTGKNNEILPLLCLGKPIRIIIPKGCSISFEERDPVTKKYRSIENPPEIVHVPDPGDAWWAVKKGCINIFEFRNLFWFKENAAAWMSTLFELLATWTRLRRMPHIFPCSIYIDEAQWVLAGTRITTAKARVKTSEIVTENALEIRGAGGRLIFFAQDYKNITPASRENMLCTILCRGAMVDRSDNPQLCWHCNRQRGRIPSTFRPKEGKFVYADGSSNPYYVPWNFPLFPKSKEDRDWIAGVRITYSGFFDQQPKEDEVQS
jgi:hypothetical protein